MQTPPSLLERLREPDDRSAWAEFVRLYTPLLYHWATRLGCAGAEAEDLVQEVFLILVREMPSFRYDASRSFRSWLRTVIVNKWRERHRTHHPHESLDDIAGPDPLDGQWETEYRQHLIRQAMELLRDQVEPTTWHACWAYIALGRPAADVAEEFGLTRNAVYLATARMLRRLRSELDGLLD